jgi:hypothetical protein
MNNEDDGCSCGFCANTRIKTKEEHERDVLEQERQLELQAKRKKEKAYNESLSLPNLMRHYQKLAKN